MPAKKFEFPVIPDTTLGLNFFEVDDNIQTFLRRSRIKLAERDIDTLRELGKFAGDRLERQAIMSQDHPPFIKDLPKNPAYPKERENKLTMNAEYEACQQELMRSGVIARCYDDDDPAPHLLPFLAQYLVGKSDIAIGCPFAMSHPTSVVLSTIAPDAVREKYLPEILKTDGNAAICGTWATENHGGSDVGRTITEAVKDDADAPHKHRLSGHQFFTSAFGFKKFMAIKTARPQGAAAGSKGLGLYLIPSHIDEDWSIQNNLEITHLKRKLGTKGLPTVEININGAEGYEIAPEGKGINAMMSALGCSRVHNAIGAAGTMHRSYLEALSWAANRETFGKPIIERPMIQKRILDIATEWKSGSALACEAAQSYDEALRDPGKEPWMRMVTAIAKFKTAEQALWCAQKTLELYGGNGYTEDYPAARLLRDAMVLPVWEGPEQIQALELMRMINKEKGGAALFTDKLKSVEKSMPAEMEQERIRLKTLRKALKSAFKDLKNDPGSIEELADEFLHSMSNILSYTLLCEEAAWELEHDDNASKLFFARHMQNTMMRNGFSAPNFGTTSLQANFDKVVKSEAIELSPPDAQDAANAPQPD